MNQVNPQILRDQDQTHIYFAPQKLWDFVHVEHFELSHNQNIPLSQLRHSYTQIEEVIIRIDLIELEQILQKRLSMSSFTEIHLEAYDHLIICWGLHQPTGKRPSPFYLEGIFHPSPRGIRFELYRGYVFGNSALNANLLSAEIFKEAHLPIAPHHASVLHFDPLTELSLAICLEWGWKLPQRKYTAQVQIQEQSIYYHVHQKGTHTFVPNPPYQRHLQGLQRFFEGESFMHKGEWQNAFQFYQNHLDHPMGIQRSFELSLASSKNRHIAEEWLTSSLSHTMVYHDFARALYCEQGGNRQEAAYAWHTWMHTVKNDPQAQDLYAYDLQKLEGLIEYSKALLLESIDAKASLVAFEKARQLLPKSLSILFNSSQVALKVGDEALAQARLSEQAQRLSQANRKQEAAWAWVQLGELWRCSYRTFDSAERAFKRALDQSPHLIAAYQGLAGLAEEKGDKEQACYYLDQALQHVGSAEHHRRALEEMKQRIEKLSMPVPPVSAVSHTLNHNKDINQSILQFRSSPTHGSPLNMNPYEGQITAVYKQVTKQDQDESQAAISTPVQIDTPPPHSKNQHVSIHEKATDLNAKYQGEIKQINLKNYSARELTHQEGSRKGNLPVSKPIHVKESKNDRINTHELATFIPQEISHQVTRKPSAHSAVRSTKPADSVSPYDSSPSHLLQDSLQLLDIAESPSQFDADIPNLSLQVTKQQKEISATTSYRKFPAQKNNHSTAEILALDPILEANKVSSERVQPLSIPQNIKNNLQLTDLSKNSNPSKMSIISREPLRSNRHSNSNIDAHIDAHVLISPPQNLFHRKELEYQRQEKDHIIQHSQHKNKMQFSQDVHQEQRIPYANQAITSQVSEQVLNDLSLDLSLSEMFPSMSDVHKEQVSPQRSYNDTEQETLDLELSFEKKQESLGKIQLLRQQLNRASSEVQADLLFEIACMYRDELLDLERAQDAFWDYLYSTSVEHIDVSEALDSLHEIYLSQYHWSGILEIYDFKIDKNLGNRDDLLLLKAATLKEAGHIKEAIDLCDLCTQNENAVRFKVDLLSSIGEVERAIEALSRDLDQLSSAEAFSRQRLAARLLKDEQPAQAAQLYEVLYEKNPSEDLFGEWMEHVQNWNDPYGKAIVVRAFGKRLGNSIESQKKRCKSLNQLAHEVSQTTPLLSIELFQEALTMSQDDVELADALLEISLKYDQYIAIGSALIYLIPLCLPGEYRGILKLRLTLNQMILTSQPMEDLWDDTFKDLKNPLEDIEDIQEIINWAKPRCEHRWNVVRAKLQYLQLGPLFRW